MRALTEAAYVGTYYFRSAYNWIYVGGLIFGVNTSFAVVLLLKQFDLVGKGLRWDYHQLY